MKIHSERVFTYPGWSPPAEGRCRLDVYLGEEGVLVVLRDLDDHQGPSVTNVVEKVAEAVRERVLAPLGLEGKAVRWLHWSRTDGVATEVAFRNPSLLQYPRWRRVGEREVRELLARYGGEADLDRWLEEREFSF